MKRKLLITVLSVFITFFTVNSYALEAEMDIHGFLSQGLIYSSDYNFFGDTKDDASPQFNEIGLNISTEFTDELRVGVQLFSKDLGSYGDNEIAVDWAFADYKFADWIGTRAGKIKTPHGLYNETRDVDMLRTSILLPQSVYSEVLREINMSMHGGGIYGNLDMSSAGSLNYQILGGTQDVEGDATSQAMYIMGLSSHPDASKLTADDIDVSSKFVLSLTWDTPVEGLKIGYTYDHTDLKIAATINETLSSGIPAGYTLHADVEKLENMVFSLEYTKDNLQLFGEFKITSKEFELVTKNTSGTVVDTKNFDENIYGWYVGASYRVNDFFEIGFYYSETQGVEESLGTEVDPDHRSYVKDICLSTKFDITENLIFKLEGHYINGTELLNTNDQEDDNDWSEEDWTLVACKMTYSF